MPDGPPKSVYWDACVWLSYVNATPGRVEIIQGLLDESASGDGTLTIYTSAIAKVEVAFAAAEQLRRALDPAIERKIDNMWADPKVATSVDYLDRIGVMARELMRAAITRRWQLKPLDAIHLGTATWLRSVGIVIDEFHTYDSALNKFAGAIGCPIVEPYTLRPRLIP